MRRSTRERANNTSTANTSAAAERLTSGKDEIIERWESRVCDEIPAARSQPGILLRNSMPDFIERVAKVLRPKPRRIKLDDIHDVSHKHGENRSNLEAYSLPQMLKEYQILREVMLTELEQPGPIAIDQRDIILDAVETAMAEAGGHFMTLKQRQESLADDALRMAEERFKTATLAAGVGVWELDLGTDLAWRSESHDRLFGYAEPVETWGFEIFLRHVHPDDREYVAREMKNAIAYRRVWDVEFRVLRADNGQVRWMAAKGNVVCDAQGNPANVVGTNFDITARKQAQIEREKSLGREREAREQAESAQVQLEQVLSALETERDLRERFVMTLSHDLRTPLTAAKISAELIGRRTDDPSKVQGLAGRIAENMMRADDMVRDLLDANQIRAGQRLPVDVSTCDLEEIARAALEELASIHGDRFVLKTHGSLQGYWSCDGVRRMVENLCDNAVKYGLDDRPITVRLATTDVETVVIAVHNWGAPIAPADQASLFEPFRRVEQGKASQRPKGWGLGLTLVKGIAESHGGSVHVSSSPEEGTTFSVVMPMDARTANHASAEPHANQDLGSRAT